jgi:hypothetical protein
VKKVRSVLAILFMAISPVSNAQDNQSMPKQLENPTLIAVVNRANWCTICKANGERFGALIMPYTAKGINIYMNDLTNDSTKAASRFALQKANIYEAVTTLPRKGVGHLFKSCGLAKDKKLKTEASGIVIFINPKTHRQLKQLSIASSDEEMKSAIENLLNKHP